MTANSRTFEKRALSHARSRAAEGTRERYEADLAAWLAWCKTHGVDASKPTLEEATEYRDELEEDYKPLTVRRVLAALSSMYEAALGSENPAVTWNPFKNLPRPPGDSYNRTEAVSDEDALKVIASTEADESQLGIRDAAILRFIYHTGVRRSSVALLERRKVTKRDGQLVARVYIKGNKEGDVELPEPAAKALAKWLEQSTGDLVFGGVSPSAITQMVKRRSKAVGVAARPHQFRAAFITAALDSGMKLHEVQAAVHHADPATTLRYDRGRRGVGVTSAVETFRRRK